MKEYCGKHVAIVQRRRGGGHADGKDAFYAAQDSAIPGIAAEFIQIEQKRLQSRRQRIRRASMSSRRMTEPESGEKHLRNASRGISWREATGRMRVGGLPSCPRGPQRDAIHDGGAHQAY